MKLISWFLGFLLVMITVVVILVVLTCVDVAAGYVVSLMFPLNLFETSFLVAAMALIASVVVGLLELNSYFQKQDDENYYFEDDSLAIRPTKLKRKKRVNSR